MSYVRCLCFGLVGWVLSFNAAVACDSGLPMQGSRDDILILVNDNSKDSCEVGRYYAEKRELGQNNILHMALPSTHLLLFPEFRIMMDRIIKHMQDNTLQAGAPAAPVCTGTEGPYYCQDSMDHLRMYTKIRYLVMTRGMPTRSPIADSTLTADNAENDSTSIDNYLSYWLVRYFDTDVVLNFTEREEAFGDGRDMRIVEPAHDGELIVGRLDGLTLGATTALIDRIIAAEDNGIYGKLYGSKFIANLKNGAKSSPHAQWYNFDSNELVYGSVPIDPNADSWRYQFGLWGEASEECSDYSSNYLDTHQVSPSGKAPTHCDVRFTDTVTEPGDVDSRTPIAENALVYFGTEHGQASGHGDFNTLLNWVKHYDYTCEANNTCPATLCENDMDRATCEEESTDVFREINTNYVGVAEGFIGYNYQSFPVAAMTQWPTGWRGASGGGTNDRIVFPEVRSDTGQDDDFSLWFRDTDSVATPKCYDTPDFTNPPAVDCRTGHKMLMYPQINIGTQTVNTVTPQQYTINFWYRADNITEGNSIWIRFRVYEPTAKRWVDYGTRNLAAFAIGNTSWTEVGSTTFQLNPALHTQADLTFSKVEVYIYSGLYKGDLGVDNFTIEELTGNTNLIVNNSFTDGHKEVTGGDHAAMYLSRLNGVAFWGSLSHHESTGQSFIDNPMETLLYFLRGLPLGDAVWWGEKHNSGIFYGDPIYSPVAVRFDYKNDADYVAGQVSLSASTINGRDPTKVTTVYTVDYCSGSDFYVCDHAVNEADSWHPALSDAGDASTALSGNGGLEETDLGAWDTSELPFGPYTLRLAVTSTNIDSGKSQTFYDYYPVMRYDPVDDDDGDGLNNDEEVVTYGSNPTLTDSDSDNLSDFDEVNVHGTDPASADTDGDGLPDDWEVDNNTYPLVADAADDPDTDGLDNAGEYTASTDPQVSDTDGDGLSDGAEVNGNPSSDPLKADTDGDHLNDREEVIDFGTDPNDNKDTDLDGMSDDWESVRGTMVGTDDALVDADNDGIENIREYFRYTLPMDATSVPAITTWHVDENASGEEDGSPSNPFSTLRKAINQAVDGDIVAMASGNYYTSGGISKSLLFTGLADQSVIIENGLILSDMRWGGWSHVVLRSGQNSNSRTRNVTFEYSSLSLLDISVQQGSKVIFRNNLITNPGVAHALLINNSQVDLINNTIAGFPVGLKFIGTESTANISNTILSNTDDFSGTPAIISISYSMISDGEYVGSNNNLSGSAPQFIDATNSNYHLQSSSLAIDSGDPVNAYNNEPANNGNRINMGAYGNTDEAAVGLDTDGDNLTDQNEQCFDGNCGAYNPYNPTTNPSGTDLDIASVDTDGDGINDDAELSAGTDPIDPSDSIVLGDINNDGVVNLVDVMLGRQIVQGLLPPATGSQLQRGDVAPLINGSPAPNGIFNMADVLIIQRKMLGLENY